MYFPDQIQGGTFEALFFSKDISEGYAKHLYSLRQAFEEIVLKFHKQS